MSDMTPFDCRANHKATFEDISPVLLEDHLRKTGSKLAKQVRERRVLRKYLMICSCWLDRQNSDIFRMWQL